MRAIPAYLRQGAIATGLMLAMPGFAATYYCDNDRSSSQYPHCSTGYSSGSGSTWIYYSEQGGDYNGDDRRYRSATGSSELGGYTYTFPSGHAYTYSAYINNVAFTDDSALYISTNASATTVSFASNLNQNTASGGWHVVGKGTSATPRVTVTSGHDGRITGTDGMRATYTSAANSIANADEPAMQAPSSDLDDRVVTDASCGALPLRSEPDIAAIQQKMLNATDNYRDVSGQYRIFFRNNGQSDLVDFKSSEIQQRSWSRSTDASGHPVEQAADADAMTTRYPATHAYNTLAMARTEEATSQGPSLSPRFYHDGNCKAVYVHRQGAVHVTMAADAIAPENFAFWLSTAHSRVVGHTLMFGRAVTQIQGVPDDFLQQKLLATRFTMWVDDKTGVLMRLLGTDAAGKVAYSIDMTNIEFDKGLNLDSSMTKAPAGWQAISHGVAPQAMSEAF